MEYCIENEKLRVRVSTKGAELQSIRGADGTEYLWQGDERFWAQPRDEHLPLRRPPDGGQLYLARRAP